MRKTKRSVWLPLVLLVYTTAMAIYFLPRNTEISDTEKWGTISLSYLIIALLWFVLRKREKAADRREEDIRKNQKHTNDTL